MNATLTAPLIAHGDGTEGPDAPVMPAPEPPGFPAIPKLPDDIDLGDDDEADADAD